MKEPLNCPSCGCLVGRRRHDGSIEIRRRGRPVADIEVGAAYCARCGTAVALARIGPHRVVFSAESEVA